jgi:hypothetical protein
MAYKFAQPKKIISEIVSDDETLLSLLEQYKLEMNNRTDKDLKQLVPDIEIKPVPHMIDGVQVKAGKLPQKTSLIKEIMELTDVFKLADLKYLTVGGLQNILELHKNKPKEINHENLKIKPVIIRKKNVKSPELTIVSDGIIIDDIVEKIMDVPKEKKQEMDFFTKTKIINYLINTNNFMLEHIKNI